MYQEDDIEIKSNIPDTEEVNEDSENKSEDLIEFVGWITGSEKDNLMKKGDIFKKQIVLTLYSPFLYSTENYIFLNTPATLPNISQFGTIIGSIVEFSGCNLI